jgi:hypothetical protein
MALETRDAALAARTILDAFYRRYREQGLELIGSVDLPRDGAKMRKAAGTVSYPTAMDLHVGEGLPLKCLWFPQDQPENDFLAIPESRLAASSSPSRRAWQARPMSPAAGCCPIGGGPTHSAGP